MAVNEIFSFDFSQTLCPNPGENHVVQQHQLRHRHGGGNHQHLPNRAHGFLATPRIGEARGPGSHLHVEGSHEVDKASPHDGAQDHHHTTTYG